MQKKSGSTREITQQERDFEEQLDEWESGSLEEQEKATMVAEQRCSAEEQRSGNAKQCNATRGMVQKCRRHFRVDER